MDSLVSSLKSYFIKVDLNVTKEDKHEEDAAGESPGRNDYQNNY
jgi:hypothetical protein